MPDADTREQTALRRISEAATIPPGREEDFDFLRSSLVLCGIWADAALMPAEPSPLIHDHPVL
jgi:hypothetical protein